MAGIDKIFSLGKRILMKNADDLLKVRPQEKIEVFKDLVVKQADGMTLWSALDKKAPHVNQSPGSIIDMMKKKSYTLKHTIDDLYAHYASPVAGTHTAHHPSGHRKPATFSSSSPPVYHLYRS